MLLITDQHYWIVCFVILRCNLQYFKYEGSITVKLTKETIFHHFVYIQEPFYFQYARRISIVLSCQQKTFSISFYRDHCLQKWLPLIANTVITGQMYEENSFLRDPSLLTFLVHILRTLDEFPIVLEASLTQGIEI